MSLALPVVSCDGCGACCESCPVPPYSMAALLQAPVHIRRLVAAAISAAEPGDACIAFDARTRRCTIYEHRPSDCRDFRVGGEPCLAARKEAGIR